VPSPQTQTEALVVLTWNQESVILSDSAKKAASIKEAASCHYAYRNASIGSNNAALRAG
jgi:hypothetical protein